MSNLKNILSAFLKGVEEEQVSERKAQFFYLLAEKYAYSRLDYLMGKPFEQTHLEDLQEDLKQIQRNYPIQYLIGHSSFRGLRLKLSPDVLIPRSETEELIDLVWQRLESKAQKAIDLGTGSGCIALSLAQKIPVVYGLDKSAAALEIARYNAQEHQLSINWIEDDILNPQKAWPRDLDLIISNPPYVRDLERKDMEANVLQHEPHMALYVSNEEPLIYYRAIAHYAAKALKPEGLLALEVNQYLGEDLKALLKLSFEEVELLEDSFSNLRFAFCRRPLLKGK
jgi:release factor glutamine methyltransferase